MSDDVKKIRKAHYQILAHLLKGFVAERFKKMAKDELLSKFISSRVDPALLVDHNLQAEKEGVDLAEMSLLELVDSERLESELFKSAERIQLRFQQIFGQEVSKDYASKSLIELRKSWLRTRLEFFKIWLSILEKASSPLDLALQSFRSSKKFMAHIDRMSESDRALGDEHIRLTNSMFRFLMKKQVDYENERALELWREFSSEAFKKPGQLP